MLFYVRQFRNHLLIQYYLAVRVPERLPLKKQKTHWNPNEHNQ